jgi:hypothetical protein
MPLNADDVVRLLPLAAGRHPTIGIQLVECSAMRVRRPEGRLQLQIVAQR